MRKACARAAVLIGVLIVLAGCGVNGSGPSQPTASGPTKPGVGEPTKPKGPSLDGTFTIALSPHIGVDDKPTGAPKSETWVARSACRDDGSCTASVRAYSDDALTKLITDRVFDYVAGSWVSVVQLAAGTTTCDQPGRRPVKSPQWWALTLTPGPDGTLTGDYVYVQLGTGCSNHRTMTATRTGDASTDVPLRDPLDLPARVASPAERLHGTYTQTTTAKDTGEVSPPSTYTGRTYCLRTGDACLTYLATANNSSLYTLGFADGKWRLDDRSGRAPCASGPMGNLTTVTEYPLPEPAPDPIPLLTGTYRQELSGACSKSWDYTARLQRVGE